MTAQTYFRNLGIGVSWFERLVLIPVLIYMFDKAGEIYSRVGFQKSLIIFVLVFYIAGKWAYQYWVKPLLWKKKEQRQGWMTLFLDYDRINSPQSSLSLQKKLIALALLGFTAMVTGTIFLMFLITGHYEIKFFFLVATAFVISFRYFSYFVKSLNSYG